MKIRVGKKPFRARVRTSSKSGVARVVRDSYHTAKESWWKIRDAVFKRDKGKCCFCANPGVEVHHIIPLSKGGTTTMSNMCLVCRKCHDKRHNHLFKSRG